MQLTTALIFAKDMDRMTAFYRDAMGLTFLEAESSDGWTVFDAGNAKVVATGSTPREMCSQS